MTDVREGGAGGRRHSWVEPGQDLDEVLARWGSEQTGPFRGAGGRHAAAEPPPITDGDELGMGYGSPGYRQSPRARVPHPSWPAQQVDPVVVPGPYEHPSWPSSGLPGEPAARRHGPDGLPGEPAARRHRPDGVPPLWESRAAAPNGPAPAGPHLVPAGPPPAPRGPRPPRSDDTGAYADRLGGGARPEPRSPYPTPAPRAVHDRSAGHRPDPWSPTVDRGPTDWSAADPGDADRTGVDRDDGSPGRHRRTGGRPVRRRGRGWLRTVRWIAAVLGVLLLVGGGFALYQYKTLSGNINRIDALAPGDASIREAAKQLDAENYLLIGSDSRAGENSKYETATEKVTGERSDTTILAHLSPKRDKAILISFPRDSWVSLPACTKVGGGTEPAHDGQFNEAFSTGGAACTVLAVQKLTGIKINHYVAVNFAGFKTMVDAVGGVPICTANPLYDKESGLRMPAGTTRLKGEQALAYVRARYGIGDGSDLGRIQRQQRFLGSMVRAATGTKLLVNPVALTKFLSAATKSLTLDRQTSFGDLKALADQLHGLDPKRVSFLTAPIADAAYTPPGYKQPPPGVGGSRVLLDDVAGRTLYDSIINDRPAPVPGSSTAAPKPTVLTVAPSEVTVRVLNGVGTGGLGKTVGGALQSAGFRTVQPENAPATAVTTVRYAPDQAEAAKTLATAVPGAVLQPDASTTLDLVVGANYRTVKPVKVGDPVTARNAPVPKPARPTAAATPTVTAADATCT